MVHHPVGLGLIHFWRSLITDAIDILKYRVPEQISTLSKAVSSLEIVNIIPSIFCVNRFHINPERVMVQKCSRPLLVLLTVRLFVSLPALLRNRPLHCTSDHSRL